MDSALSDVAETWPRPTTRRVWLTSSMAISQWSRRRRVTRVSNVSRGWPR